MGVMVGAGTERMLAVSSCRRSIRQFKESKGNDASSPYMVTVVQIKDDDLTEKTVQDNDASEYNVLPAMGSGMIGFSSAAAAGLAGNWITRSIGGESVRYHHDFGSSDVTMVSFAGALLAVSEIDYKRRLSTYERQIANIDGQAEFELPEEP
jgi:hypothetical protein